MLFMFLLVVLLLCPSSLVVSSKNEILNYMGNNIIFTIEI